MINLTVDLTKQTTPFPHYWEKCVGSGHAALALREDWRRQLKQCHDELGFQFVRFHGLLNDDMSVCTGRSGSVQYSFFNVDSICDWLLAAGIRPFIELSFMPTALASGSRTVFHYRGNITPPASDEAWQGLIQALTHHLVARYGADEVRQWFFEVWNEPNLSFFWDGTQEDYFRLYRHAAAAIKSVDSDIPVGGPSTACNAWISELKAYCQQNGVPLDFLSSHHYPTDAALGHGLDMESQMARTPRGVLREMMVQARAEAGGLPLYYTEWNNSPSSRDPYHDDPYAAAFAVKSIMDNQGLVDAYSFWTFSDIFEEVSFPSAPFHGGFGLLNLYDVPKPTYRAFQLLHRLGDRRVDAILDPHPTVEAVAVGDAQRADILLYNHNVPLAPIAAEQVRVTFKGWAGDLSATVERVDAGRANPKRCWQALGSPEYPAPDEIQAMMEASQMSAEPVEVERSGDSLVCTVTVPPHGIAAMRLART